MAAAIWLAVNADVPKSMITPSMVTEWSLALADKEDGMVMVDEAGLSASPPVKAIAGMLLVTKSAPPVKLMAGITPLAMSAPPEKIIAGSVEADTFAMV